jgi:hypothetical protein
MTNNDNMRTALAAAADGVRRANDLTDVMTAISAAAQLAAEALQQIEQDLLRITDLIGKAEP